ncbi:MAG: BamA/TamA family outer membrane protein [Candidatus Margulisiibacteriota bacterium]
MSSYLPAALPQKKSEETNQANSATPTPKTPPPSEAAKVPTSTPVAIMEFIDGSKTTITEEDINKKIGEEYKLPQNPRRTLYLHLKYKAMTNLMNAAVENKENGKLNRPPLLEPTMASLDNIIFAIQKDLNQEAIQNIEERIYSISSKNPDKPFLLILFADLMLSKGKISLEKAKQLLSRAINMAPGNPEVYYEVYNFYFGIKEIYTASTYLEQAAKLKPAYQLELGNYYVTRSKILKANKDNGSALKDLEAAEKAFKKAAELNLIPPDPLSLTLADLSQKKAEIYYLQKEYLSARSALEFSTEKYEQAVEAHPEVPGLHLRLHNIYLMLKNVLELFHRKGFRHPLLNRQDEILNSHLKKYGFKLRQALTNAEKLSQGNPPLLRQVAKAYMRIGEVDKALEIFKALKSIAPNPLLLLQMGDLLMSKGKVKDAFGYYEEALKIAKGLDVLTTIFLRISSLEAEAVMGLARLKAPESTSVVLLNFLVMGLMFYASPPWAISNILGKFNKSYREEDLQALFHKARALKQKAFSEIYRQAKKEKQPLIFHAIAEGILAKAQDISLQIKQMEEMAFVTEEKIKFYKNVAEKIKTPAAGLFKRSFNKSLIKALDAEFQKAMENKDTQRMSEVARNYFGAYFFFLEKSRNKILDESHKKILSENKEVAFDKGMGILEKTIEFARETKNTEFSFAVYQLAKKTLKNFPALDKNELIKQGAILKIRDDSLKATIDIARDNGDLEGLCELGKGIYTFGPFAIEALEQAIALAGNDKAKLFYIGEAIYVPWRKTEKKDLIQTLETKEALRRLVHSAYQKILERSEGLEKLLTSRKLWVFGDYGHAYQGCISLIEYYKSKNDQRMLGNVYYELALMAVIQGKTQEATKWLTRALDTPPETMSKESIRQELEFLKTGKHPDLKINGELSLNPQRIRAAINLCVFWAKDKDWDEDKRAFLIQNSEKAIADLYSVNMKKAKVKVRLSQNVTEVDIQEETIHKLSQGLDAEFQEAKNNKDLQKLSKIVHNYFRIYFLLRDKSENEMLFKKGIKALEEILSFGKEIKDIRFTSAVFKLAGIFRALEKKELKIDIEKITEVITDSEEATIEIAKNKEDIDILLDLFSIEALEKAIALAGDDHAKLFEIGDLIYTYWRTMEGKDLISIFAIKKDLRQQALSAYKKILERAQGKEKMLACRKLWRLGDHFHAYQGYSSLIDYYKSKNDKKMLGNVYYEMGLMAAAQGKIEEAKTALSCALYTHPDPLQKETIRKELAYLKTGKLPESFIIKGNISLSPPQIRAAIRLYDSWKEDPTQAVLDLYSANEKSAKIKVTRSKNETRVVVQEQKINKTRIVGFSKTDPKKITREFRYVGVEPGKVFSTDPSKIIEQLAEAANRIKSFTIKDARLVNEDGKNVLIVKIEEQHIESFKVGGGGSNVQASFYIERAHFNLYGGGEKFGYGLGFTCFYPKDDDFYHTANAKFYYFDPHLFVLGKNTPVAGGFNLEKTSRVNYENNTLEDMIGGRITAQVKIAEKTYLGASPGLYYIDGDPSYLQPSVRFTLSWDGRDSWLFPKSGGYLSTSVEPGMQLGNFTQFFVNNFNEGKYYVPLFWDMTLAFRGVFGIGYNLLGGGRYSLGGGDIFNRFVRGANGSAATGLGILAGNIEVRAPIWDFAVESIMLKSKIQLYIFGDIGIILCGDHGLFYSAGVGARFLLPWAGLPVNISFNLLQLPSRFPFPSIWFGDAG